MAICFQKIVIRLAPINSIITPGRHFGSLHIKDSTRIPFLSISDVKKNVLPLQGLSPSNASVLADNSLITELESKLLRFQPSPQLLSPESSSPSGEAGQNGPSEEQIKIVYEKLRVNLPNFFRDAGDYTIYNPNIVFENNIHGKTTVGLYNYVKEAAKLRLWGHIKYAFVKLEVIKMTTHTEDSSVKIRWRIRGISGSKIIFTFWRYKLLQIRDKFREEEAWMDGFSTMYIDSNGLIYKHIADKVIPDKGNEPVVVSGVADALKGVIPKLALFVGVSSEISPIISGSI